MSVFIPRGFVLGRSPDRGRDKSSDQRGEGGGRAVWRQFRSTERFPTKTGFISISMKILLLLSNK